MAPKTILGIDPGTNILGYGVIAVDAAGKPSRPAEQFPKLKLCHCLSRLQSKINK